jgi:hypothetical protein
MSNLLQEHLILEYAVHDSMGRNKGWHTHGMLNSLDDMPAIVAKIQADHPGKDVKVKLWQHSTAFGSQQIA